MNEFTILATNKKFILRCRTEYYNAKSKSRIWAGIRYKFEGKEFPIWLGYIQRDSNYKQKLNDITKDIKFVDKRNKGYYCIYCRKFSDKSVMGWGERIVTDESQPNTRMIVNDHYDGCRGWE